MLTKYNISERADTAIRKKKANCSYKVLNTDRTWNTFWERLLTILNPELKNAQVVSETEDRWKGVENDL